MKNTGQNHAIIMLLYLFKAADFLERKDLTLLSMKSLHNMGQMQQGLPLPWRGLQLIQQILWVKMLTPEYNNYQSLKNFFPVHIVIEKNTELEKILLKVLLILTNFLTVN